MDGTSIPINPDIFLFSGRGQRYQRQPVLLLALHASATEAAALHMSHPLL
jgi:hypothetical protein